MVSSRAAPLLAPLMRQALPRALRAASLQTALRPNKPVSSPASAIRLAHTIPRPPRTSNQPSPKRSEQQQQQQQQEEEEPQQDAEPASEDDRPEPRGPAYYQLSFTCVPCGHRSHHNVSKQGYHFGSTLITCPSCHNRHVISDHLNIFGDRKITVEDLLREKGQLVKKGSLGEDGDIEFWPEETLPEQAEGAGKTEKA